MNGLTLALVLSLSFFSVSCDYCGPWIAIDWKTIDVFPNDTYLAYDLAAPILYCDYLTELTYLNGYHGGIGIVNARTNKSYAFSFQGYPSFGGAFLPQITKLSNGTYDLKWFNAGRTFIYAGINTTYWQSLMLLVATMDGNQFGNFMQWISTVNNTYSYYNPWAVYKSFPDQKWLAGFECFQFSFAAINKMKALGAHIVPGTTKLPATIGSLYSHIPPVKVSISDPQWRDQIVDFYLLLDSYWKKLGVIKFFEELWWILVDGDFFVRDGEDYYFVELSFPYFEIHWTPVSYLANK
eukprot:TRINITY_DN10445_c0_g1_i3.p1 TRINITY_DN10445_c0_g1~~TRINITY_DN10445_c0_g1_i3.p1  ORF type:complete len:295 (+),score=32.10 TRINITY_DN10445_c0_g1_i3:105-989(+)